jgi:hypothetical protein
LIDEFLPDSIVAYKLQVRSALGKLRTSFTNGRILSDKSRFLLTDSLHGEAVRARRVSRRKKRMRVREAPSRKERTKQRRFYSEVPSE